MQYFSISTRSSIQHEELSIRSLFLPYRALIEINLQRFHSSLAGWPINAIALSISELDLLPPLVLLLMSISLSLSGNCKYQSTVELINRDSSLCKVHFMIKLSSINAFLVNSPPFESPIQFIRQSSWHRSKEPTDLRGVEN